MAEKCKFSAVATLARELRPADLTILLDVPVEVAATRRRAAGRVVERYDADAVQARVAENYRRSASADPRAIILDGRGDIAEVAGAIAEQVDRLLTRLA